MSQYDSRKKIESRKVSLTWHGEPTMLLLAGDSFKTSVGKGETIMVSYEQSLHLLKYSHLWTLEGDKPVDHGYMKARAEAAKVADERANARTRRKEKKTDDVEAPVALTASDIDLMTTEKEVRAALKARDMKVSRGASLDEMKALLKETVAGSPEQPATTDESSDVEKTEETEKTAENAE